MCGNSVNENLNENNDTAKGIEETRKQIDALCARSPNEVAIRRILDDLRERHARELETWYRRLAEIEMSKQRYYFLSVDQPKQGNVTPDVPDNSKVICPNCSHQFGAICVDDQKKRNELERQVEAYKQEFHAMRGDYRRRTSEHVQEIKRLTKELSEARAMVQHNLEAAQRAEALIADMSTHTQRITTELDAARARVAELEREISQAECEGAKWIGSCAKGMISADIVRVVGEESHSVAEKASARVALLEGLLRETRLPLSNDGCTGLVDDIDAALAGGEVGK